MKRIWSHHRRPIGLALSSLVLVVSFGTSAAAPASTAVPTASAASTATQAQTLGLEGAPNARDLGGYRVQQGGHVRTGRLFRSGELSHLTAADLAKVNAAGLHTVIDLRTPEEAAGAPDPAIPGAAEVLIPVLPAGTAMVNAWNDATTNEEMRAATDSLGGPAGSYIQLQRELVSSYGITQLARTFDTILSAQGAPVLFHCTAGQDRTGIVAYMMLRLLGVSQQDATADYLTSNIYNSELHQGYIDWYMSQGYSEHEARAGIILSAKFIETSLRHVDDVYGSFDRFARYGLGLSDADIHTLRDTYVVA